MDRKKAAIIAALFALVFLFKLYYLGKAPFSEDEALYAEMIEEAGENPSFLPTYFGYPAVWKPGTYFIAYSHFLPFTKALFTPFEIIYRFPNLLFSLLSAYLVYLLCRRFGGEDAGILSALAFACAPIGAHVDGRLLMEPLVLVPILASMYFYTKEKKTALDYLLAGAFAFFAAILKYLFALLIPALAIIYFLASERKNLRNPAFIISLFGAPLGISAFFLALSSVGMGGEIFLIDAGRGFAYGAGNPLAHALSNLSSAFGFLFLYFAAGITILMRKERPKIAPFMLAWAGFLFIMLFSATFRQWYLYYSLPPFAFIAGLAMAEKGKADSFSILLASVFVFVNLACFALSFQEWEGTLYPSAYEAKAVGLSLAGGNSTMFIGGQYVLGIALCYKALQERATFGHPEDFGYVMMRQVEVVNGSSREWKPPPHFTEDEMKAYALAFITDYHAGNYTVEEDNFFQYFWNETTFRRKTLLREFNTIVVSPPMNLSIEGYERTF
ncbi:MAG: glycosyltransferase family 39 protein, partial [Candidatus Bilamarchaeaceae archaeon]